MRVRSHKDFWAGLIFIGIAASFIVLSRQYNMGALGKMGPGYFPTLVAVLLAALGLAITVRALATDGPELPSFQMRPLLVTLAAVVLFGVALEQLGLIAAIAVLVIVSSYATVGARPRDSIALALLLILFSLTVFVWVLGLPLTLWPEF